ncbi:MAG TPA: o-succinylbenzoate--CoA ligase [Candidatus Hydrogenedens sp.]|nr:o-succinylbenzoate--CoA ligase [Candidatus Hydrogenedens sp.]
MFTNTLKNYFREYSKYPLVQTCEGVIRFGEVWEKSDRYIKSLSVFEGKRIGLVSVPSPETLILICALMRLNPKIILFSPFEPSSLIYRYIQETQPLALLCDDNYASKYTASPVPVVSYRKIEEVKQLRISGALDKLQIGEECIFIIMTSGSSAAPKKVVLTGSNLLNNAYYSNRNLIFQPGDVWLLSLPLFHVSGLSVLFRSIESGGSIYIPSENIRWWEMDLPPEVTHISVVSTIMKRLLDKENYFLRKRIQGILLGGGPIPEGIVRRCYDMGLPLYTTYGLSEMSSQVTTTCPDDTLSHLLTSGKPLVPDTVKIGKDGDIFVRGPCRFQGYLRENTVEQPFDEEGWFVTQDIGKWTSDGYLQILGRKDNVFICGGENIQPEEIENQIMSSGFVDKVMVVPKKDEEYGYVPVAFVDFSEDNKEKALNEYLQERISGIKIPKCYLPFPSEFEEKGIKISRKKLTEWVCNNIKQKGK